MKIANIVVVASALALASLGSAQSLKDRLKVHKDRLPQPSHALVNVHGRRFAFKQKDGTHQPRLLGKQERHNARKSARGVTHHVTKSHKHIKG